MASDRQVGGDVGRREARITCCALALVFILSPALQSPAAAADERVAIRGRIIDETGTGVGGQVVRLLKSRSYLRLGGLRSLDQSVEEARTMSDALGFFEMETRFDSSFPYVYLRCYDPKTFDAVKYRLPEDRDISKRLRSGRAVEVSVALRFQPDWPEIRTLLETYEPGSQVGQILRSLGLPSSRTPDGPGREVWTYGKAAVAYVVEGSRVLETRTLTGATRSPAAAAGTDAPQPAVRVDAP